jgi:hypothetical protein
MKKATLSSLLLLSLTVTAWARPEREEVVYRPVQIIDVPTADTLGQYGYNTLFRFAKEGNLQGKFTFGIFPRLNLGFALDSQHLIGNDKNPKLNNPTINVRFRIFDGKGIIPAFAIGYDGQGYNYNRDRKEYDQREKGFYLVGTTGLFTPDLQWTFGVNVFDFDEGNATRGFTGFSYTYEQTVGVMAELDSATEWDERRINYGLKYFITPVFTVDAVGRYVPIAYNSSEHETERIVILSYTGSF